MAYPDYKDMEEVLLKEIQKRGGEADTNALYAPLADIFHLSHTERTQRYNKSNDVMWNTRVRSVRATLKTKGELHMPDFGTCKITQKGLERLNGTAHAPNVGAPDLDASLAYSSIISSSPRLPVTSKSLPRAVQALLNMAERTKNILLYGPPGTGKTWLVTQFAKAFTDTDKVEMVTFHQSFAYEEFVEEIKPVIVEGKIDYGVSDGVFKRVCKSAQANPQGKFLLIIDEINRANIAKVLGELITLIEDDKRLGEANEVQVTLPYSGERFGVPPNLNILGTMNTADRSIALLDLALRRRFTFVEMPPDPMLLSADVAGINLQTLLTHINQRIAALLDTDHRIGHSYLMDVKNEEDLHFAWYHRVMPLLSEYFHRDGERLQAVLGEALVTEITLDADTKTALGGIYEEMARYEVRTLAGEAFLEALQKITE